MVADALLQALGGGLLFIGLLDVFLTILHPDRDGPVTMQLDRGIWRIAVELSRATPRFGREIRAFAGPAMLASTILTWLILPIVGFGLIIWPDLGVHYRVPDVFAPFDFWDAVYFSGITFTTVGLGDISPVTTRGEIVAIGAGLTGFILGAAAIAFILNVFQGVDRRDGMALRALAESGGTWSGVEIVRRTLQHEDVDALRGRTEGWAIMLRGLHERLYRFQALAFYIRTRGSRHEPERMLALLGEYTLAVNVLARRPDAARLRTVAENLDLTLREFTRTVARHHGTRALRERLEAARPTVEDRARLRSIAAALPGGAPDAVDDPELLGLAARVGVLMDLLERITHWSLWRNVKPVIRLDE